MSEHAHTAEKDAATCPECGQSGARKDGGASFYQCPSGHAWPPARSSGPCVDDACRCRCTWRHDGSCPACLHRVIPPGTERD